MPITEALKQNALLYPDEIALVEVNPSYEPESRITWKEYSLTPPQAGKAYRREMTWQDFDCKANRFANLLLTRGCKKGDKVALLMMNCIEWLPIYFGALKAGAVVVPLNYRYTSQEILYCLQKSDSAMLVFGPEFIGRIEEICESIPQVKHLFYVGQGCPVFADSYQDMIAYCPSRDPQIPLRDSDDGAIYFSSGTTGFPKAILHNHESLMHAMRTEQNHHRQTHEDVFLCIPPLYHTGAKMHWFGSLMTGGKAVLLRGAKPQWIMDAVSRERCTIVWLLVPWAQDILDAIDSGAIRPEEYELNQWRLMHIGAQPVPPSLIKRWKKVFPHHSYDTNYGLSESIGPGCVHLGLENERKVGAIGVPGFGWQVKILAPDGREARGREVGELCVKGPGVMTCFYHDEKATREVLLPGGWLRTGDMAMRDEEGFLYLVDRKKDVIISGGENLYPVQIEDFLHGHPAVKDVAVIGLPHPRLGEIPAAIIELKEGASCTEEEINAFCASLPRYKRPRKIIFAPVPRNPTGKIEKPALRQKYGATRLVEHQTQA